MLKHVLQGFEFTGFGLHVVARWWDVELRFYGYGAGAMWGQAGDNLYLYGRRSERHWCWRDAGRALTSGRERVSAT